ALGEDKMELGLGIHGEPGVQRVAVAPAREVVETLVATIVTDRGLAAGSSVALLVNNLGATPVMEMNIIAGDAITALRARNINVVRAYCGTFLTSIEMAGVSLSLIEADEIIIAALDAPTDAPAWPAV